ncbi:MAG: DedA family protein [Lysobacteraceae bacterium]|nr:MAG: DedA family protein [Xanthomonadaceae bacterium]
MAQRRATATAADARARAALATVAMLALVIAAIAAWAMDPGLDWPDAAGLLDAAARFGRWPPAPLLALACFAIGGLVVFPVNLLIAASIVAFGPIVGGVVALAGSVLSAWVVHELGRRLPPDTALAGFGERGERLRRRIVGHGLLAIAIVRIVPIAPYSVVGFVSGVARVRRIDYLVGTALGMAPGIILYAVFVDRALAVLVDPHPLAWLLLATALALLVAFAFGARAWQRRRNARHA